MTRLALPFVLTVVFAYSGFLQAGCNHPAHASDCRCNEAAPCAYNTHFPGTCRDCVNGFAYSLWADYCQTKRHGPAYRIPRHRGCLTNCQPACRSCGSQACDSAVPVVNPEPAAAAEPTEAAASIDIDPQPTPRSPRADYFGAPRHHPIRTYPESPLDHDVSVEQPAAEFDETTMPATIENTLKAPVAPVPVDYDADAIKRSVDEAVDEALEAAGDASEGATDEIDDRSANYRQPWLKIFRPRSR